MEGGKDMVEIAIANKSEPSASTDVMMSGNLSCKISTRLDTPFDLMFGEKRVHCYYYIEQSVTR